MQPTISHPEISKPFHRRPVRWLGVVVLLFALALQSPATSTAAEPTPIAFPTFGALGKGTPLPPTALPIPASAIPPTALPPTERPLPTLKSAMMGVQIHPYIPEDHWRLTNDFAQFMGMKWLKIQLSWKEIEPQQGQYSQFDALIAQHIQIAQGRNGFRILVSIVKAPAWARPPGAQEDGPPKDPQQFAVFVTHVMDRYGLRDSDAIELWNEPNIVHDWTGVPLGAASYMKYFDAGYKAVRAKSGGILVISAGLAPTGDSAGGVDDRRFLQEMYNAGLKNYANIAVGIHPYGWANPPDARCCTQSDQGWKNDPRFYFLDTIDAYRATMVKNGHGGAKLWATEFGWSTFDNLRAGDHVTGQLAKAPSDPGLGWMRQINEAQRTAYTIRAFEIAQNGDYAGFMGPMMLWNLNIADIAGYVSAEQDSRPEVGFSILNGDGFPRTLYDTLQRTPKQ